MGSSAALEGIKVLDLTKLAPGPFCTMILGDLGADIIKIEEAGPPTGRRAQQAGKVPLRIPGMEFSDSPFNAINRNKKSIGLNLKSAPGKEIFLRLAQEADVVVEEFRPGVTKRLGIDYETLSARNPRIIYCAVTGYGQDGPYRDLVGHDINYIAIAGALSLLGRKGQDLPTIPHNLLADYAGGGLHAALGVLAALVARQRTGRGQYVDISMLDAVVGLLSLAFSTYFATGRFAGRGTSMFDGAAANYNTYETKDGKIITIAALEPWFFANLCRAIGRADLIEYEFDSGKRDEIRRCFEETFKTKTRDEWFELLSKADICVGPMLALGEVAENPQVRSRKMIVEVDAPGEGRIKQVGIPVKLSDTPGSIRSLTPALGQHTDEILRGLGYAQSQIAKWREEGAIK